ncbi:MAG TPA: glycine zipper 2TM domain-containing protein [Ramlibacter sp.]
MKQAILVSAMGVIGLASAGVANAQEEVGRVISSTPVVQQVPVSRQVCNQQMVQAPRPASGAGAIIGGIVGGLLGNTVGGGMGRAAATGVGVVAGAAVGNNLEQRDQYAGQPVTQCATQTSYENRTVAYNVQYEYAGKTYNVQMPYDPGPTIKLQIQPVSSSAAPMGNGVQTIAANAPEIVSETPSVVYPAYAYPAYGYGYSPYYGGSYWYPPVSLSLGYMWHGGGGHHWHR